MVCDGPDPPDNSQHNLSPPPRHLITNGNHHEDSDDEQNEHFGYEPLAQGPEAVFSDAESSDDETDSPIPTNGVPDIESMEASLTREVWNVPHHSDSIEMDSERAQQVMSAMANFALPQTSIPDWAQSVSEEQWKKTLNDKIDKIRSNR